MTHDISLTEDEHQILRLALLGPMNDPDPEAQRICQDLQSRELLQWAGSVSLANGWLGSPRAFVLTQDGWNHLKSERRPVYARRRG